MYVILDHVVHTHAHTQIYRYSIYIYAVYVCVCVYIISIYFIYTILQSLYIYYIDTNYMKYLFFFFLDWKHILRPQSLPGTTASW